MASMVEGWYREHHGWLQGWLRKRLGCGHQAADVAHDTFIRLLQLRDCLPALHEPRAYLTTTARHILIDRSRRQALEAAMLAELAQAGPVHGVSPEQQLAALQVLAQLLKILDGVPEKARRAFLLHYLDGLPQSEVAATLAVSERMVRKYLAQVLLHCHQLRD